MESDNKEVKMNIEKIPEQWNCAAQEGVDELKNRIQEEADKLYDVYREEYRVAMRKSMKVQLTKFWKRGFWFGTVLGAVGFATINWFLF